MKPLRVGVVGVGSLGQHHARIYAELPQAELVAVVDRDEARAAEIAGRHGCAALHHVGDLDGRVDAVSVASPTVSHREVAERLLDAGIDVLVEKPLAPTLDECDAILRAAERSSRLVMVGHTERFNPAIAALVREVKRPRFFEIHRLSAFSARSTDIDVVLDLMIHDLDLLLHLDGSDAASIDASGVAALTDKIDIANARIRMSSGCVANLTASRISAEPTRRIRVFQERSYLSCDTAARRVDSYRVAPGGDARHPLIAHETLAIEDGEPLARELVAFLESVRDRSVPPVDGRQGRRALELAHRVRDAIDRPGS